MMLFQPTLRVLATLMLLAVIVVVVLGAYTRLVDAGLGCPDWPTCYGHLWVPDSAEEIAAANQAFVDTPVETHKTWPEQIHRIFASSLGLLVLIFFFFVNRGFAKARDFSVWNSVSLSLILLVVGTFARVAFGSVVEPLLGLLVFGYFANVLRLRFALKERSPQQFIFVITAILAGLVIVQGLFGMWTVTLKLWPQVVTAHLLGGFATLCLISLIWITLVWPKARVRVSSGYIARFSFIVLLVVILQVSLGGWTSSNYAALACPDFPKCQNSWLPEMDLAGGFNIFQGLGPNYLGGQLDNLSRVAIHYAHRLGALLTSAMVLGLCVYLWRLGARRVAMALSAVLLSQLALGVANVVLALPLSIAVLHNACGALLLVLIFIVTTHSWREHAHYNK